MEGYRVAEPSFFLLSFCHLGFFLQISFFRVSKLKSKGVYTEQESVKKDKRLGEKGADKIFAIHAVLHTRFHSLQNDSVY